MPILEVCATNIQSAIAAQNGGAHRIELCSALGTGGVTPSVGLLRTARKMLKIPINVLIRPREGNFCYDDTELAIMLDDIRQCREEGADGVVVGALNASGQFDLPKMQAMLGAAKGMDTTCHRAFDFVSNPFEALEMLIGLGFPRVLTSGQAPSAYEGRVLLKTMVEYAADRIQVMPGAGLSAQNIRTVAETTGATEFHLTAKKRVEESASGNKIDGLEQWYWESDADQIRAVLRLLR